MLQKNQIRLSIITLFFFCAALLAHSEHYAHIDLDKTSTVIQHDCHLCQQGIDSANHNTSLAFIEQGVIAYINVTDFNINLVSSPYILALLRAPPVHFF